MGRKPIKTGIKMRPFTLWLDPQDMERVGFLVDPKKISDYVRAAIAEKLERDGAPPYDPVEQLFHDLPR